MSPKAVMPLRVVCNMSASFYSSFCIVHLIALCCHNKLDFIVDFLHCRKVILINLIFRHDVVLNLIPFGFLRLYDRKFLKAADHIQRKSFTFSKKHNRFIPKIFGTIVVVQPGNAIPGLPNIQLHIILFPSSSLIRVVYSQGG